MTGHPSRNIRLSINLLTYNSSHDLERFFNSLKNQSFKNYNVIVIDNASNDNSVELSRNCCPGAKIIRNKYNLGYAGGHNVGLSLTDTEYVLVANPDVTLTETFLERLVVSLDEDERLASVGGKLLGMTENLNKHKHCGIIDTTGIIVYRNRRFVDRGQGEDDMGQYENDSNVFGLSGALVMYRMKALREVCLPGGHFFDKRYFMYREDIDLAWRLQHYGWRARYIHTALGWHRRTAADPNKSGNVSTARHRFKKSQLVNYWSYRNHLYTLLKNERLSDFWRDGIGIVWYELKKLTFIIIFEPGSLRAWKEIWQQRHTLKQDRKSIQSQGRCHMYEWRV